MNSLRLFIFLLLLAAILTAPVLAQLSPHFDLDWSVLSGGGGQRSSNQFEVDDVLGQWPDGLSRSANYQIDPGFWTSGRAAQGESLYLPLVLGPGS